MSAKRFNDGKLRLDLIPHEWQIELARVMTFGAVKYGDKNWEAGLSFSSTLASLKRHIAQFEDGHDIDPETNCLHLTHAATNSLMILSWYLKQLPNIDDRSLDSLYDKDFNYIKK